jgi:hypothetical protein
MATLDQNYFNWNDDIEEDLPPMSFSDLIVYSRDWTVETIVNQIRQENIELNPKFQRRNAWNDTRRSLLIESLIAGVPVPEIVLAEQQDSKRKFLVLDGKQRLLTVAGFIDPTYDYWNDPRLVDLKVLSHLNGDSFEKWKTNPPHGDPANALLNADIRCTVLGNITNDDVLYNIFYRLNTGSVPLSTQELRQVLCKGPFANFLVTVTNKTHPIQQYLSLEEADPRLRDVEILLRFLALEMYGDQYKGNLKKFLDLAMKNANKDWSSIHGAVENLNLELTATAKLANELLKESQFVGRKYTDAGWEMRFNKAVFEVQMFYFHKLRSKRISTRARNTFKEAYEHFCVTDPDFIRSVEVTTKSLDQYRKRFKAFRRLIKSHFDIALNDGTALFQGEK